ncbi:MAG: DEAD/DEAH box helicase [Desulfobacteraceae bacterium]|nr:DEAD/DEAH box helicase [Desulfobacteraceae bacterium]MDH3720406.1 DEAD/DEAH box helicase [Desulfobacteraceae bacterium]MDH3872912.1 DEAD/DEAH box helicase [Desulfobacteraceae bacterium]
MKHPKRYFHRSKKRKGSFNRDHRPPKIKPGADAGLKKVFAGIGVPAQKPFKPDPFQLQALSAVKRSDCLVTVPTGAGKTWIAEQAIARILKKGGRSWYASPLKALSNTKYSEFSKIFGPENVGILTGDRKEKLDAPVIVGTTEILRNQLYDAMYQGTTLLTDLVVLDEAHFLGDEDRGVVWEEIMIYLPSRIPLLLLSATIGNAKVISQWLSSIRGKKCIVVEETKRPVPLYPLFFHPSGTLYPLLVRGSPGKGRLSKKVAAYVSSSRPPYLSPPNKLPPFGDILRVLNKYRLLPAIFFLKSRANCDNALDLCEGGLGHDRIKKDKRSRRIEELVAHNAHIARHRQLWHLEHLAVGAHHSGQLPAWKLILETLMTEGLLDAVFATSTVAAGVNFPARTIVFLNSDRFNGREFLPLSPTEFHQMTGRAGRRGMDHIGFALAIPGKYMDVRLAAKLMKSAPSDVSSQIKINFSMVLNLLLSHTPEQIEDLLKKSFATYMIIHARKKTGLQKPLENDLKQLWQDFVRHLDFLKETGYADKSGRLTVDGIWASQLRVDQPLMIAEGFRCGVFPDNDPALLAAVTVLFVNERESDEIIDKEFMPKALVNTFLDVKKSLSSFSTRMSKKGFETRPLIMQPAATLYAWATGLPWEKVISIAKMEEGDLAMLILRTADNLRHIRALKDVFPEAASAAGTAIDLIMRYPVVMDYE